MENPNLTFLTSTLLNGDRSGVAVLAHEIGHSWCGNLVGYKTNDHCWLNEGFTKFLERKLIEIHYGKPSSDLDAVEGIRLLDDFCNQVSGTKKELLSCMVWDLEGIDPDDASSCIPCQSD